MNLNDEVTKYFKEEPLFRKKKNKTRGIVNVLIRLHPALKKQVIERNLTKDLLVQIFDEYILISRIWNGLMKSMERENARARMPYKEN